MSFCFLDVPMQVNLGLFSFNGTCGYLEKPTSLCQSTGLFDPKCRTNVENVVGYQIDIKLISGQFLCQDREPTYVDIEMYGMYADATKRHEYRLRTKRWNGFQAVYDDTDIESNEFAIRFSNVILPEMASLRFVVSEEDGTFIGQSFIPVAHLRPGYRHLVLRNQMNIPVHPSSLFIYIRKEVHVDAKNKELIDKLVSPTSVSPQMKEQRLKQIKFISLPEQHSHSSESLDSIREMSDTEIDYRNDSCRAASNSSLRNDYQATENIGNDLGRNIAKRNQSIPAIDPNWYQSRLIAPSRLYDAEQLCTKISLHDIEQTRCFNRKQENIQAKLRRTSFEYDKVLIDYENREVLIIHNFHFHRVHFELADETYILKGII